MNKELLAQWVPLSTAAITNKLRRVWIMTLLLLMCSSMARAAYNPDFVDAGAYKYPDIAHIYLRHNFFNYDGANSGWYNTKVNLLIDDYVVCDLHDIYDRISDVSNEDYVKGKSLNKVIGSKDFTINRPEGTLRGTVILSDMAKTKPDDKDDKWYSVMINIMLSSVIPGKDITVKLQGNWYDHTNYQGSKTLSKTFTIKEDIAQWPKFATSASSNKRFKVNITDLAVKQFRNYNGTTSPGYWKYDISFSPNNNPNKYWPSNKLTVLQKWEKETNKVTTINSTLLGCGAGTTQAYAILEWDNYNPKIFYPFVTHHATGYTLFPSQYTSESYKKDVYLQKNCSKVVMYGYPRPGNMSVSYDLWQKFTTVSWSPQFANSSYANKDGKWVVFRRVKGSGSDFSKLGTVDYKDGEIKYEDKTSKEYNLEYEYRVAFQPNAWGINLSQPDDATNLATSVYGKLEPSTPFKTINATDDEDGQITVTCEYYFEDAATKNYELKFYRREKGKSNWEYLKDLNYTVTSKTDLIHKFVDTNPANSCVTYQYKVEVNNIMETSFTSAITEGSSQGGTSVTDVTASRGTYSGTVRITWNVNQNGTDPSYFNVQRRLLGSTDENDYVTIHTTSGVAETYSYEDATAQPGTYYQYQIQCYRKCLPNGATEPIITPSSAKQTDGFALATGIISGRVSYGTGNAVDGVKVSIQANASDEGSQRSFYAMKRYVPGSNVSVDKTTKQLQSLLSKPWTMQAYVKMETFSEISCIFKTSWNNLIISKDGQIQLYVPITLSDASVGSTTLNSNIYIVKGHFYNISYSYDGNQTFTIRVVDENGNLQEQNLTTTDGTKIGYTQKHADQNSINFLMFGYYDVENKYNYTGIIDECRFWSKALTKEEILSNYNRILSGSEDGLYLYWKLDEGIENQSVAYDYSKTGGVSNGNHGTIKNMDVTDNVPNEEQLSVCGLTDENGNYTISGIPFSGDGTSYSIRPTKGVHEFSPSKLNRFVSAQSLVHNGVDFTDVSSFTYSGTVYYLNTNIPVEGVQFTVDGTPCTKDGSYVTTNSEGKFTISVPIGSHYISAYKDGHTIVNNDTISFNDKAYYPSPTINGDEAVFNTTEFLQSRDGMVFYDTTLVPIAGRVVGGSTEDAKPLGFGESYNNIGRAVIKLTYGDKKFNTLYQVNSQGIRDFVDAQTDRTFSVPDDALNCTSSAVVKQGKPDTIYITTDPKTGEFAAMVPPLDYNVESIGVMNSTIKWTTREPLNAKNTNALNTDSIERNGKYEYFKYVASIKKCYHSAPKLSITQVGAKVPGAFGEHLIGITADNGDKVDVLPYDTLKTAYDSIPTKELKFYSFSYPIFRQNGRYKFKIKLFEEYVNNDIECPDPENRTTIVPMEGTNISFTNKLGSGTSFKIGGDSDGEIDNCAPSDVELDEKGEGYYEWTAGLPNINGNYTLEMSASYGIDNTTYAWPSSSTAFKGIVLGELPSGNNFVTGGPDEVSMILRDPAGSGSNAYIEQGQSFTSTKTRGGVLYSGTGIKHNRSTGLTTTVITGVATGALVASTVETEISIESSFGLNISEEVTMNNTSTRTVTTTKRISTSDSPDYVGSVGDVFIGNATNYVFGKNRQIGIFAANKDSKPALKKEEIMSVGSTFGTEFAYTQNYVEEVLIPNFQMLRNSCIKYVTPAQYSNWKQFQKQDSLVYISCVDTLSDKFGSNNWDTSVWGAEAKPKGSLEGPSYKIVLPKCAYASDDDIKDNYNATDTIAWFNAQISAWEQVLASNEEAKVKAIENRTKYLRENFSFDSGSSISSSTTTTASKDFTVSSNTTIAAVLGLMGGVTVNDCGWTLGIENETSTSVLTEDGETKENSMEVGFNLMESGFNDALSVDVLNAPDGFGPIFYTRAGQTSCPYEDEVVTKYYRPGYTIQQKTQKIEDPKIYTEGGSIKTNVPSGKAAVFTIKLVNNSETSEDCWFNLNVIDKFNPNGAAVTMDGKSITDGRTIFVPAGEELFKTVLVSQTNPNVYDYNDLRIRISSTCQPDNTGIFPEIADTVSISVSFAQTGSDVTLTAQETALNTSVGSTLNVTISDFDRNSEAFKGIRLQVQQEGDPRWTTCKEWVKENATGSQTLLPSGNIEYSLDMSNKVLYPDGQWNVRAVTVNLFGSEVLNPSEVITFYKDMVVPQLISNPSPANGVLTADGEISVNFNEDIRYGALTDVNNFLVTGQLNDGSVAHDVALNLNGGEGAKTNAGINLDNRSFAVNMWVRYSNAGELFAHGTSANNMKVAVNSENKLVVTIGNNSYVSDNALQKNKWQFLSFSYDATKQTFSSNYAYDAASVVLFNDKNVGEYTGTGSITLGKGLTGQIHEVTLWDNARQWSVAQGEMYDKKSRYTSGLMGYWSLDEGHGNTAIDQARSRTLTLPSSTAWYIEATNYVMPLNGEKILQAKGSTLNIGDSESYTAELWFRADNSQNGKASIFGINKLDALDIYLNESGQLILKSLGTDYVVASTDYRDNQWHHLALNVLKSTAGAATVYVDGKAKKQLNSYDLPALQAGSIILGGGICDDGSGGIYYDHPFKGAIDEVRIWKGHRTSDVILNSMYSRISKNEKGLAAYYPFENIATDEGGLITVAPTYDDMSPNKGGSMISLYGGGIPDLTNTDCPPLKAAPKMQNVGFNFTANERKILIHLTELPQRIEGCTIHVKVREVSDAHQNKCNDISWDVFVRQNQLLWQESEVTAIKHGSESVSFEATITNNGGSTEIWSISGMPDWLSVSTASGSLPAISERKLKFTVDPGLTIGTHEAVLQLTGSLGISEPLVVRVTSTSQVPGWNVDPADYEFSMNINGQLKVKDAISQDENDIVAAFRGDRCVGVANPTYYPRYDAYYVLMNVYGNGEDQNQPLTYKVFDASTGNIYPVVTASISDALTFTADKVIGTMSAPNVWTTSDEIEQVMNLNKGWQWVSLYVDPVKSGVDDVFGPVADHLSYIVSENAQWTPTSTTLSNIYSGKMYKTRLSGADTLNVVGMPVNISTTAVNINPQWNWIGYLTSGYISLNEAFADLEPQDGDVVKSQTAFATWNQTEWVGTLGAMTAGQGYEYFSSRAASKSFHYPNASSSANAPAIATTGNETASTEQDEQMEEISAGHMGNMSVIATVLDFNGNERNDVEIRVMDADNALRSVSLNPVANRHFVTISGDDNGAALRFMVTIDGMDYMVPGVMFYTDNAIIGTLDQPLVIDLSSPTGIGNISADNDDNEKVYNLGGQRLDRNARRQVIIRGHKKMVVK